MRRRVYPALIVVVAVAMILLLLYEREKNTVVKKQIFAMDTYMEVTAYGKNASSAVEAAEAEIIRLNKMLSINDAGDNTSQIAVVNSNSGGVLTDDAAFLMEKSVEIGEKTDGAFDVAIYPLMKLWGFSTGEYRVPSQAEIEGALDSSRMDGLTFDSSTGAVTFSQEGMAIDFGGIAKGYTSTRIMEIFEKNEVTSGIVSLGGNVQVHGLKPDGSKWRVAIADPEDAQGYLGAIEVCDDTAVITSGGYQRYFEENGKTYHHIIDPATGYPADSGLKSVSIVSKDGTLADGLSTSIFIMGLDKGITFWRESTEDFGIILLDEAGQVYVTEDIAADFTSIKEIQVIYKNN